jgi:hypothetical protein
MNLANVTPSYNRKIPEGCLDLLIEGSRLVSRKRSFHLRQTRSRVDPIVIRRKRDYNSLEDDAANGSSDSSSSNRRRLSRLFPLLLDRGRLRVEQSALLHVILSLLCQAR